MSDELEKRVIEVPTSCPSVDALWSLAAGEAMRAVVPADGCVDLIVRIRADQQVEVIVHDVTARAHEALVDADTQLWGVRLRAGHGGCLLERGTTIAAEARRQVEAGHSLSALGDVLAGYVDDLGGPPAVMRDFLAHAEEAHGTTRLTGNVTSAGERELQRAARRWLGMTSKSFLRIVRVRAAREAIRAGLPFAVVAAEYGYADQAHLTRDSRAAGRHAAAAASGRNSSRSESPSQLGWCSPPGGPRWAP